MMSRLLAACLAAAPSLAEGACSDGSQPILWESAVSDGSEDVELGLGLKAVSAAGDSITLGYVEDMERMLVFLRFRNIGLPRGAEVDTAKVIFTVKEAGTAHSEMFEALVLVLAKSDPFPEDGSFRSFGGLLGSRWTTANLTYRPAVLPEEAKSETPDLAQVVQEYLSYPSYSMGSNMTFIFGTQEDATSAAQSRTYYSFESGQAAKAPRLSMTYCILPPVTEPLETESNPSEADAAWALQKQSMAASLGLAAEEPGEKSQLEGAGLQQWSTMAVLGLAAAALVTMGLLTALASKRYRTTNEDTRPMAGQHDNDDPLVE